MRQYGLDAAAAAAFLGLLWPRLRRVQTIAVAAAAAVIAIAVTPVLIPGLPVLVADLLTVALLAALIGVQTVGAGSTVVLDARVPALAVAAALFALRVPFVLVIVAAAATAAAIRAVF